MASNDDKNTIRTHFEEIRAQAGFSLDSSNELTCTSRLITYKLQAICPGLTFEDKEDVAQLVHLMAERGWLSDEDRTWCMENNIPVKPI